jgi:hypothetical protein
MVSALQIREVINAAAAVDRSEWSGAARSAEVVELLAARERLDALLFAVVGAWDRVAAWALDGSVSPVAWLAHRCPVTRQDAAVLVRSARHVARHEQTAKALDAGDVTAAHVQVAARAVKHRADLYAEHETVLLDAARSRSPAAFRSAMAHWRRCADAVDDQKCATKEITGRSLDIVATFRRGRASRRPSRCSVDRHVDPGARPHGAPRRVRRPPQAAHPRPTARRRARAPRRR